MYKPVEHKTVEEQLIDAYKAQLSTYDALLSVKDAQVAFLEAQVKGLKLELDQYKRNHQNSTGLTAKEREEIAKLSKEIMEEEPREVNEWPEEINMTIEIDDKKVREVILSALGMKIGTKENTTTANSDVDYNESGVLFFKGTEVKID